MGRRAASRMPRSLWHLVLGAGLVFVIASPVAAAEARDVHVAIEDTFVNDFYSDVCGSLVLTSVRGNLKITLFYDASGALVKEIDRAGGGTITYAAPETGLSFSFPFNTSVIDYGAGAAVGSTFTQRVSGLFGHVPGFIESDAGTTMLTGIVTGFDEEGLPMLEVTDVLESHGHSADGDQIVAATCAALGL